MKVAFQGEFGAFSEQAAWALFPGAEPVPCPSMDAVFESVEQSRTARGVIPIENSLHGSVHQNYDLLRTHSLQILGELHLRIRHYLMAQPGTPLHDVQRVLSHPQALGQCQVYLRSHLAHAETVPTYDTSGAARLVARGADSSSAAIAPQRAAEQYGLSILAERIESHTQNFTRFLALGPKGTPPLESEENRTFKTSILFALRTNVPGALFKSLAVFALRDLNLYKIESRPLIGSPGKYLFYLDVGGHLDNPPVQRALAHLEEITAELRVLGSYPSGRVWDDIGTTH